MTIRDIGTLVIAFAAVPAVLFVTVYLRFLPRLKRTRETWHLLTFTAVVAVILVEELLRRVLGTWPWHHAFIALAVLAAGILLWQRLFILWRYRPRRRTGPTSTEPPSTGGGSALPGGSSE